MVTAAAAHKQKHCMAGLNDNCSIIFNIFSLYSQSIQAGKFANSSGRCFFWFILKTNKTFIGNKQKQIFLMAVVIVWKLVNERCQEAAAEMGIRENKIGPAFSFLADWLPWSLIHYFFSYQLRAHFLYSFPKLSLAYSLLVTSKPKMMIIIIMVHNICSTP